MKLGDEIANICDRIDRGLPVRGRGENIQRELNALQTTVANMAQWSMPGGGLEPNMFQQNQSHPFSVLPHECASLYQGTSSQALSTTWTAITNFPEGGASWERGMRIDRATGKIYVTGVSFDTVLLFQMSAYFNSSTVGVAGYDLFEMKYLADDTSERPVYHNPTYDWQPSYLQLTHVRRVQSNQTNYEMQVKCTSGLLGDDAAVTGALFTVSRLR